MAALIEGPGCAHRDLMAGLCVGRRYRWWFGGGCLRRRANRQAPDFPSSHHRDLIELRNEPRRVALSPTTAAHPVLFRCGHPGTSALRTTSGYEDAFDDLGVSSVCKGPTHDEIP